MKSRYQGTMLYAIASTFLIGAVASLVPVSQAHAQSTTLLSCTAGSNEEFYSPAITSTTGPVNYKDIGAVSLCLDPLGFGISSGWETDQASMQANCLIQTDNVPYNIKIQWNDLAGDYSVVTVTSSIPVTLLGTSMQITRLGTVTGGTIFLGDTFAQTLTEGSLASLTCELGSPGSSGGGTYGATLITSL